MIVAISDFDEIISAIETHWELGVKVLEFPIEKQVRPSDIKKNPSSDGWLQAYSGTLAYKDRWAVNLERLIEELAAAMKANSDMSPYVRYVPANKEILLDIHTFCKVKNKLERLDFWHELAPRGDKDLFNQLIGHAVSIEMVNRCLEKMTFHTAAMKEAKGWYENNYLDGYMLPDVIANFEYKKRPATLHDLIEKSNHYAQQKTKKGGMGL